MSAELSQTGVSVHTSEGGVQASLGRSECRTLACEARLKRKVRSNVSLSVRRPRACANGCQHLLRPKTEDVRTLWTSGRSSTTTQILRVNKMQYYPTQSRRTEIVIFEPHSPVTHNTSVPLSEGLEPFVDTAVCLDGGCERGAKRTEHNFGVGGKRR